MIIEKKTWPKYFEEVKKGKKTFDVRLADWNCKNGDIILLREWDPKAKKYTGRQLKKTVKYVVKTMQLKDMWPKEEIEKFGFLVIGFE